MKTVCIKIGGATVDAEGLLQELGRGIAGIMPDAFPVIVHGGGKEISRFLDLLGRKFEFIEGMRVTDAETVSIVQMVLSGGVNKRIVNALLREGVNALGISGVDGDLFNATRLLLHGKDIGFVGEIERVSPGIIEMCRRTQVVPVVSPISRDGAGNIYNVNADLAAAELAVAIKADDLVFISDVRGVVIDGVLQREIAIGGIEQVIAAGQVTGGMVPKLRSAADAVHRGVGRVHICGWQDGDTLKRQLTQSGAPGTVIRKG